MKLLSIARDLRRRKSRDKLRLFVAEGVRAVEEALMADAEIVGVLISEAARVGARTGDRDRELFQRITELGETGVFKVHTVTAAEFDSAAATESPQGILAVIKNTERAFSVDECSSVRSVLILDGIQDPGNAGTVLRSARAFNVDLVVSLPGTVDIWNPKVVRSSMGAIHTQKLVAASVGQVAELVESRRMNLWLSDMEGVPSTALRVDPLSAAAISQNGFALAVGNEGMGIGEELQALPHQRIAVPTANVESLNVAVATSILLYEFATLRDAARLNPNPVS